MKEKKYLIIDDYALDKDDSDVTVEADDKLPDDITLKNVVMLITCFIKDRDDFFSQLFLEGNNMVITCDEKIILKRINVVSEKELNDINFERLKKY